MLRLSDREFVLVVATTLLMWIATYDISTEYHRFAGRLAVRQGIPEAAKHHLDIVVTASESSTDGADLAMDLLELGTLYWQSGQFVESRREFERALEALPDDPLSGASTRSRILVALTAVYQQLGLVDPALESAEMLLGLTETRFGASELPVAEAIDMVAAVHEQRESPSLAEALERRALSIREARLGSEHPDVATTMTNLGRLLVSQGHFNQAELYLERSASILRVANDRAPETLQAPLEGSPDVASSLMSALNHLGWLYGAQGRPWEAVSVLEEALELGANAPKERAVAYANASIVLLQIGRAEEALRYSERAIEIADESRMSPGMRESIEAAAGEVRVKAIQPSGDLATSRSGESAEGRLQLARMAGDASRSLRRSVLLGPTQSNSSGATQRSHGSTGSASRQFGEAQ